MRSPAAQILLAAVLAVGSIYYWGNRGQPGLSLKNADRLQALPSIYLQTARSWTFNEQGRLTNVLEADRVDQFSHRNESLLGSPRFYSHSGDDRTWSARADKGQFQHDAQNLHLLDNVVLSHDQTGSRLETRSMDINFKKKIATSEQPVTITHGANNTQAYGMTAYLETEQILLQPNVESIYVQPRP